MRPAARSNGISRHAKRPFAALALLALSSVVPLFAENTGASFLKIGVGARAIGMGSAFTARADDATAAFWNPAGLSQLATRQVSAMHTQWLADSSYEAMAYAQPTRWGTFAGSLALFSQGDLDRRGDDRQQQGSFQAQDAAFGLSFGGRFSNTISYGLGVKTIRQTIDQNRADGLAADLGLMQRITPRLTLGLAVQNLGPAMKFIEQRYELPLSVTAGANLRVTQDLRAGLDIQQLVHESKTAVRFGSEYWLMGRVALRGGYLAQTAGSDARRPNESTASQLGLLNGFQMGVGLSLGRYQLDYALVPAGELGNTQRLSLTISF